MKLLGIARVLLLGLVGVGCVQPQGAEGVAAGEEAPEAADLDRYNDYPIDRQSYQLELGNLVWAAPYAAFEYVNRVVEDRFSTFTLQSFETSPSEGFVFFFKDRLPSAEIAGATTDQFPHRCLRIAISVSTSPTDAYPEVTSVRFLADAKGDPVLGGELCVDDGEI